MMQVNCVHVFNWMDLYLSWKQTWGLSRLLACIWHVSTEFSEEGGSPQKHVKGGKTNLCLKERYKSIQKLVLVPNLAPWKITKRLWCRSGFVLLYIQSSEWQQSNFNKTAKIAAFQKTMQNMDFSKKQNSGLRIERGENVARERPHTLTDEWPHTFKPSRWWMLTNIHCLLQHVNGWCTCGVLLAQVHDTRGCCRSVTLW